MQLLVRNSACSTGLLHSLSGKGPLFLQGPSQDVHAPTLIAELPTLDDLLKIPHVEEETGPSSKPLLASMYLFACRPVCC